jgi:hypothetical protein
MLLPLPGRCRCRVQGPPSQPAAAVTHPWLPASALSTLPQASQTLLWVVRNHAGELAPYTMRASVVGGEAMPGKTVEAHMAT